MNKKLLCLLPFVALTLASCEDTDQTYTKDQFLGGTYESHVYDVWERKTRESYRDNIAKTVTLQNEPSGFFCGNGDYSFGSTCWGYSQAKEWHPDWFKTDGGATLKWGYSSDITETDIVYPEKPGDWIDNSSLYDIIYSQNKRLDRFYPEFSKGYLSKLYNGQIKCNGWSYYAMAVLSNQGYGTMFPHQLKSAEYFAASLLVSTGNEEKRDRKVECDIHFTFYEYDDQGVLIGIKVTLESVALSCNAGAAKTSLVGFRFADASINPNGIVGMSVTWDLIHDSGYALDEISNDFSDSKIHDGLSIYEVLLPDSVWY